MQNRLVFSAAFIGVPVVVVFCLLVAVNGVALPLRYIAAAAFVGLFFLLRSREKLLVKPRKWAVYYGGLWCFSGALLCLFGYVPLSLDPVKAEIMRVERGFLGFYVWLLPALVSSLIKPTRGMAPENT